jgi:thioredoxin-dependent peroxiredoxin
MMMTFYNPDRILQTILPVSCFNKNNIVMAKTKLGETIVNTSGNLPVAGETAPIFTLTGLDLKDVSLTDFKGKNIVLNIFPSVDTRVCALSVREFNKRATLLKDTLVLCVSMDLPFAFKRFCGAEGIENVIGLSGFRENGFGKDYGIQLLDGSFKGLYARAVLVIDPNQQIRYSELMPSISLEPDYEKIISVIEAI